MIGPKDIGKDYARGVVAGCEKRKQVSGEALREEIAETKREIKRVGADYYTGPFLVGYKDGLQGACE